MNTIGIDWCFIVGVLHVQKHRPPNFCPCLYLASVFDSVEALSQELFRGRMKSLKSFGWSFYHPNGYTGVLMWPCGDDLLRGCSYSFQLLVVPK